MATPATSSAMVGSLAAAGSVYVSACAAEIAGLPDRFAYAGLRNATVTGIFSPLINDRSYADPALALKVRAFLLTRALKRDMALGHVAFHPWRYGAIDRWLGAADRFDAAVVMLSPPDRDGMCSLGVQADFFPSFFRRVPRVIGFINPNMPATAGHDRIPYAALHCAIDHDEPLPEMAARPADDASAVIAHAIAGLVPDGATVQLGTGQIPSEVLAQLSDHRDLRVHTGIVDDNIMLLEQSGALAPDMPIVTGTAIGTRRLYDAVADPRRFALKPVAFTHATARIAANDRFTAINSALRIDLLGQVSGEAIGGRIAATPGGMPDFVRAAADSPGGRSIIAVRASGVGGRHDGIVALMDDPSIVTVGAVDADIFVTEYGVAHVRDLTMDARAEAIIAIAAPDRRGELQARWRTMRDAFFGGTRT